MEKTHYRKAFKSPYLSSADIVGEITLTIEKVSLEPDQTKKTKDLFNTAHFVEKSLRDGEPLKPMILNATNSKTMKSITGSPWIEEWKMSRFVFMWTRTLGTGAKLSRGYGSNLHRKGLKFYPAQVIGRTQRTPISEMGISIKFWKKPISAQKISKRLSRSAPNETT